MISRQHHIAYTPLAGSFLQEATGLPGRPVNVTTMNQRRAGGAAGDMHKGRVHQAIAITRHCHCQPSRVLHKPPMHSAIGHTWHRTAAARHAHPVLRGVTTKPSIQKSPACRPSLPPSCPPHLSVQQGCLLPHRQWLPTTSCQLHCNAQVLGHQTCIETT